MRQILYSVSIAILGLTSFLPAICTSAQVWNTVGPYGGDARSFAYSPTDPSHILLGTTNSWIYETHNGTQWDRLSKISTSDSLVVDHIVFDKSDSKRIVVGAWMLNRPDGGIFISEDDGHHWQPVPDMQGQSVRALAQAASNPKIFVAGTLKGVYRSEDGGQHWILISPPGSIEIHEVESIAIDPVHPEAIYAGTWHLPWKTQDGGRTWQNIKQGLIDDSDVFSIIIDPHAPDTVYASACSGIYKSIDAGTLFHKIQGIPSTARRTRVLMQDPANPDVIFAGTTEGLYRTTDAGTKWTLMTPKDLIINDVYVDPKNSQHILMATDRSGVLDSDDGAQNFHDSNSGFSERQVSSMVSDPQNSNTIYAGVLNDKRFGGVFVSKDAGQTWNQMSAGLNGDDVFTLAISNGNLLAGTNHGIFRWNNGSWAEISNRLKESTRKVTHIQKKHRSVSTEAVFIPNGKIEGSVHGLAFANGQWYAATADGIYQSEDNGFVWRALSVQPNDRKAATFSDIAAGNNTVFANGSSGLYLSQDQGKSWQPVALPAGWDRVRYVAVDGEGHLWIGGRLGAASSENQGQSWQISAIPINDISGLQYDPQMKRILVASYDSDLVFGISPTAKNWIWWNPGWRTHIIGSSNGRMIAATLLHGVIVQPAGNRQQTASNH